LLINNKILVSILLAQADIKKTDGLYQTANKLATEALNIANKTTSLLE
jgi:hypothetical protein